MELILIYLCGVAVTAAISIIINLLVIKGRLPFLKFNTHYVNKTVADKPRLKYFKRIFTIFIIIVPATIALSKYYYFYGPQQYGKMGPCVEVKEDMFWAVVHQISDAMVGLIVILIALTILIAFLDQSIFMEEQKPIPDHNTLEQTTSHDE